MSVALVALAGGLSAPTSSAAPADLLARMGTYTQRFERSMSALIADERYEQSYSNPRELPAMTRRSLRSVVLMIRLPLDVHWLVFRDVLESDGQPVSSDRGRLERLFRDSAGSALQHAQALLRESARFNIGPVERNFNTPTLPLVFLLPENQNRIRVSREYYVEGHATYGHVRRFEVTTEESISVPR